MTDDQHSQDTPKRAADDVAADMQRQLEELNRRLSDLERQVGRIPENPLSAVAGDPTALHEGQLSHGATLSAATHEDDEPPGA